MMRKTSFSTQKKEVENKRNANLQEINAADDFFLHVIKTKGFAHGTGPEAIREHARIISLDDLCATMQSYLFSFEENQQTCSFAHFIIQQLLQSQSDLAIVEAQILSLWNSVQTYKDQELVVKVYANFLNDVFTSAHIIFYNNTHQIIDQIINGDAATEAPSNLARMYVKVERLVDVVTKVFKQAAAKALLDNTGVALDIPHSMLQGILTSLLNNLQIIYQHGQGLISAQDLQNQCLLEYEKLKIKLAANRRKNKTANGNGASSIMASSSSGTINKNRTFLGVNSVLYVKDSPNKKGKGKKHDHGFTAQQMQMMQSKGYLRAQQRVSVLIQQNQNAQMDRNLQSINQTEEPKTLEGEIKQKIDAMIQPKRGPQKVFQNNPPKKEVAKKNENNYESTNGGAQFLNSNKMSARNNNTYMMQGSQYNTGQTQGMMNTNNFNSTGIMNSTIGGGNQSFVNNQQQQMQQFQNYQISKMYDSNQVSQFGSSETKLKQMQIKLQQAEVERQESRRELNTLKREMAQIGTACPSQMANQIVQLLQIVGQKSLNDFNEHITLREKNQMSCIELLDDKNAVKTALQAILTTIGRQYDLNLEQYSQKVAFQAQPMPVHEEEDSSEDSEEKEEVNPKDMLSGLIMGFKKKEPTNKNVNQENVDPLSSNQGGLHHREGSLDTESILRKAQEEVLNSQGDSGEQTQNVLPLPAPLSSAVKLDEKFLKQFAQVKQFELYRVVCNFYKQEPRQLSVKAGQLVSIFHEIDGWLCGFVETSPGEFGFMPKEGYMQFERVTNDKDGVRQSPTMKAQMHIHPEKVDDFLNNIYDEAIQTPK